MRTLVSLRCSWQQGQRTQMTIGLPNVAHNFLLSIAIMVVRSIAQMRTVTKKAQGCRNGYFA
jgi:hypothetical protein